MRPDGDGKQQTFDDNDMHVQQVPPTVHHVPGPGIPPAACTVHNAKTNVVAFCKQPGPGDVDGASRIPYTVYRKPILYCILCASYTASRVLPPRLPFTVYSCISHIRTEETSKQLPNTPRFSPSQPRTPMASEDIFAHLTRLSQKAGVRGTLILSRQSGAIVRASGLVSRDESTDPDGALPASTNDADADQDKGGGAQSAEDVARIVWNFANAAGEMLDELNGPADDEMKLLRIRSKKKELVIVPGKALLRSPAPKPSSCLCLL